MQSLKILFVLIVTGYYVNADITQSTWKCIKLILKTDGSLGRFLYMRLADHTDGIMPNDLWFDRLVYVHHEGEYDRFNEESNPTIEDLSVTLNGAIISESLVLTSLNPFRNIIRFRFKRYFTTVCLVRSRQYRSMPGNKPFYHTNQYNVVCARPVIPASDDEVKIDLWHGYENNEKLHSPLHDLIVFRVHIPFVALKKNNRYFSTDEWRHVGQDFLEVGPIISYLATKEDNLGRDLKFGMLGDKLSTNMVVRRNIYTRTFEPEENVLTNCDAWLPREWGWFICLRNIDNLKRLASGAMLYSKDKLFGVGSFALFKGNLSVLVFTDVRPYTELIYNTCTVEDQDFKAPKNITDKNSTNG